MIRRSPKTGSAVEQQHEELARRENELRDRMQKLQQMIEDELLLKGTKTPKDVVLAMKDSWETLRSKYAKR